MSTEMKTFIGVSSSLERLPGSSLCLVCCRGELVLGDGQVRPVAVLTRHQESEVVDGAATNYRGDDHQVAALLLAERDPDADQRDHRRDGPHGKPKGSLELTLGEAADERRDRDQCVENDDQ